MPHNLVVSCSSLPDRSERPEISMRTVWLEGLMLGQVELQPHAVAGSHAHPEEQIGLVLDGSILLTLDGEQHTLIGGDIYTLPSGVEHGVVAGPEGARIVEAWSPPRAALQRSV